MADWGTPHVVCVSTFLLVMNLVASTPTTSKVPTTGRANINVPNSGGDHVKVLLFPYGHGYSSHIMDFQRMAAILIEQGYNVSVLINNEDSQYMDEIRGVQLKVHSYPCCSGGSGRLRLTDNDFRELTLSQTNTSVIDFIILLSEQQINLCEQLMLSRSTLEDILNENYQLLIVDYADSCSRVVAQYFDIPLVIYSGTGLSFDAAFFPNLPTIVPTFTTNFMDEMSFFERAENMVRLLFIRLLSDPYYFDAFDDLKHRYNMSRSLPPVRKAYAGQLTFAHSSWAFDFPRPLLPTVVSVGGMHIEATKDLKPDLYEFLNKTAQKGLVVVSFGSLVDRMGATMTETIAAALAKVDQGVIWRYGGEPPKALGENTLTLDWIPQTDLLALPLTKVFITHCGIHGTYEAVHYAIPVVAMPLFADEFENANKLVRRAEMGVLVDHKSMSSDSFHAAIQEVLTNHTYRDNAKVMSRLLSDRPLSAKDTFLYYVDFVIRYKGSGTLMSKPVMNLDTVELYGVDVVLFLLTIVCSVLGTILTLSILALKCCLSKCRLHMKSKQE